MHLIDKAEFIKMPGKHFKLYNLKLTFQEFSSLLDLLKYFLKSQIAIKFELTYHHFNILNILISYMTLKNCTEMRIKNFLNVSNLLVLMNVLKRRFEMRESYGPRRSRRPL